MGMLSLLRYFHCVPLLTLGAHTAARVTLRVCLSVCLSVKSHLTSRMSNRAIKEHTHLVAYEHQKLCGDLPETTAFSTRRTAKRHGLPMDCQRHSALPKTTLLMLLARVGVDSTMRAAAYTTPGVANFRAHALALFASGNEPA